MDLSPQIVSLVLLWSRELWESTGECSTLTVKHLSARKAVTAEQRPQPSPLARPNNLHPKLCSQVGGPVWRQRWDGINKKLRLVPSPA